MQKGREDALRALGWIVIRWVRQDLDHPARWLRRRAPQPKSARPTPRLGKLVPDFPYLNRPGNPLASGHPAYVGCPDAETGCPVGAAARAAGA
ncbi:hypothetical protein [Nocardia vinacea]|uniref:hypothetical protein n=1 Tax=Nocardia vinacea TaxID=96468 RepID=UPI00030E3513|nr:hypothetical protein [Nocardia vinacea]